MYVALLIFHLFVCIALVGVVLIQSGKGGGLAGGAFGGSAQTVFGGRGATDFITRATMILGGTFFVTSLVLAMMATGAGHPTRSLIQTEAGRAATGAAPAAPSGPGATPSAVPSPANVPSGASAPAVPAPGPAPGGAAKPPAGHKP